MVCDVCMCESMSVREIRLECTSVKMVVDVIDVCIVVMCSGSSNSITQQRDSSDLNPQILRPAIEGAAPKNRR